MAVHGMQKTAALGALTTAVNSSRIGLPVIVAGSLFHSCMALDKTSTCRLAGQLLVNKYGVLGAGVQIMLPEPNHSRCFCCNVIYVSLPLHAFEDTWYSQLLPEYAHGWYKLFPIENTCLYIF